MNILIILFTLFSMLIICITPFFITKLLKVKQDKKEKQRLKDFAKSLKIGETYTLKYEKGYIFKDDNPFKEKEYVYKNVKILDVRLNKYNEYWVKFISRDLPDFEYECPVIDIIDKLILKE